MSDSTSRLQSPWLHTLAIGVLTCLLVLFTCWLGIISRPMGNLASLWPANACVLGVMVRFPVMARPAGWVGALIGYLLADLLTGNSLATTVLLTLCNLAGISAGYWAFHFLSPELRSLRSPNSVPCLLFPALLAAATAAVCGGLVELALFGGNALSNGIFWFITESATYILILPAFLTFPERGAYSFKPSWWPLNTRRKVSRLLPLIALIASCLLCWKISGPGAIAFMVPALLWCALRYSLFSTAILTLLASCCALLVIEYGVKAQMMIDMSSRAAVESFRIGISLMALAPLTVASVMCDHSALLKRLSNLASHDQLTGLLNRRAFSERSNAYLNDLRNRNRPLAVLMLDLDHFKKINDNHGHPVGDSVLKHFAQLTANCLREGDILGRLGGEEFAVLLPDCPAEQAGLIAERIRKAFAQSAPTKALAQQCSVSIGAVTLHSADASLDALLQSADNMLYEAKHRGRNQVALSAYKITDSTHH